MFNPKWKANIIYKSSWRFRDFAVSVDLPKSHLLVIQPFGHNGRTSLSKKSWLEKQILQTEVSFPVKILYSLC